MVLDGDEEWEDNELLAREPCSSGPRPTSTMSRGRWYAAVACTCGLLVLGVATPSLGRRERPIPHAAAPGSAAFNASPVRLIDERDFNAMLAAASISPRARKVSLYHHKSDDLQAFVNAWTCAAEAKDGRCSYAQPHRHREPEAVVVLEGLLAYFVFEDENSTTPTACHVLGPGSGGPRGIHIGPHVYHTMTAFGRTRGRWQAIVWETKLKQPGTYTVERNKEWLPGSLSEQDALSQVALRRWLDTLC